MKAIESIPNAARTFEALRSLGYNLNSSVSDIVDNALSHKVRTENIWVKFKRVNQKFICRIFDDGCGMTDKELQEAMRIGTESSYSESDLGKFGMGMKTASLSHCNILTVISFTKKSRVIGYRWDLSHVKDTKKWQLLQLTNNEIKKILKNEEIPDTKSGTFVFWDDMFLIDAEYRSFRNDKFAEYFYLRILGDLKLYLRMIYHRFLDKRKGPGNFLKIYVNDDLLKPWDPFCTSELNTNELKLKSEVSELEIPGYKYPIKIKAYILPAREMFSSDKAWEEAKGLLSWNDSQGYYIYRANRLIRFGGWHGTKAKDEHDKLARVSIDIHPSLDGLFRINVNKNRVQFPEVLFNHLKNNVNKIVIREAQKKYRKTDQKTKISNKFRNQNNKLNKFTKQLVKTSHIKTNKDEDSDDITVLNPSGIYLSNKINEFIQFGSNDDFEVVCDSLDTNHLWKLVCNTDEKFKVIINTRHPFYTKIYHECKDKKLTSAIDAFIFSLAFAELFNRNENNSILFDTFKSTCSKALEKLIKEDLI